MKQWRWALLIFELALFALILILPQVDLPDFTFHGGSAPIVMRARIHSVAAVPVLLLAACAWVAGQVREALFGAAGETVRVTTHSRLSLLCTLIC